MMELVTSPPTLHPMFTATDRLGLTVIAEVGVNHDGSVEDAHALVDVAADAKADAVKFQTFDPASLVSAQAAAAPYQATHAGVTTQLELLQRYVLPTEAWRELVQHAEERGIAFMSTAFDPASLDLVCDLGVRALKLGSGELTNKPLLCDVASRGLPVIASTGMATRNEVADAVGWLAPAPALMLLHCVSSYPAPVEQANLRAIPMMREAFGVPVGWSDHTLGPVSAIAAVALGAAALEKHITLDSSRSGPDHAASADPESFVLYVTQVRAAHSALGDGNKVPAPSEAENVSLVRRSWHAARNLRAGQTIRAEDLLLLRPADGMAPAEDLTGRLTARAVTAGNPVRPADLVAR